MGIGPCQSSDQVLRMGLAARGSVCGPRPDSLRVLPSSPRDATESGTRPSHLGDISGGNTPQAPVRLGCRSEPSYSPHRVTFPPQAIAMGNLDRAATT